MDEVSARVCTRVPLFMSSGSLSYDHCRGVIAHRKFLICIALVGTECFERWGDVLRSWSLPDRR